MKTHKINIDFKQMEKAFREYVRKKAINANSTIIYQEGNRLIEEDPATSKKTILKVALKAS